MSHIFLVTGATGHLGSAIIRQLALLNQRVRILILPEDKNIPMGNLDIYYGDVTKLETLNNFFGDSEDETKIVIHCAGIVSISSKFENRIYQVNVNGTKNIVQMCEKYGVEKLIYVSSVHAIKEEDKGKIIRETVDFNPDKVKGIYAKTKAEATSYVQKAKDRGLNICIIHPSGLCGPFDSNMGYFTTLVIEYYKKRLVMGASGGYDFVDVRDVASGIINCAMKSKCGGSYILSNKYYSVKEILDLLYSITKKKKIDIFLPIWFLKITATFSEGYYKILKRKPLYTPYSIYTLNSNAIFSHEKADDELGYKNRDMKETLEDTIKWLKDNEMI